MNLCSGSEMKIDIDLVVETSRANLRKLRIATTFLAILQLMLAGLYYLLVKEGIWEFPAIGYFAVFLTTFILMSAILAAIAPLSGGHEHHSRRIRAFVIAFCSVVMYWGIGFAILDQFKFGQITVYLAVLMFTAILFDIAPHLYAASCVPAHIVFLLMLFLVAPGELNLKAENALVSTASLLVALLIRRSGYASALEDFHKKRLIEKKNEELKRANEELRKANEELLTRSITDGLTGLNNRRMFEDAIKKEWLRCQRYSITLSVIMMDVDHFKPFNDFYGHQVGDYCLQQIGTLLLRTVRFSSDIVARYGGEEFIIALPYTDARKAAMLAERIRTEVERLSISHEASSVSDHVTISLGVATTIPAPGKTVEDMIRAADMALYQAKDLSRNRIVSVEI